MANRRKRSRCLWSITMELYFLKGLLVLVLLQICQAQDAVPPPPNPEPALPSLVNVIDAVKAAFEQAVKISEDSAVREVFEQVVEELVPQQDIAMQSPAIADGAEDATEEGTAGLTALHAVQEQAEATLDSSEQMLLQPNGEAVKDEVGLVQESIENPVEAVHQPNEFIYIQEQEDPVSESTQEAKESAEDSKKEAEQSIQEPSKIVEESVQDPAELVESFKHGPKIDLVEKSEVKSLSDQRDIEPDHSSEQVDLPLDSVTEGKGPAKEAGEKVEGDKEEQEIELFQKQDTLESGGAGETQVEDRNEEVKDKIGGAEREAKVQKRKLPKQIDQKAESLPDQEQSAVKDMTPEGGAQEQNDQDEGEQLGAVLAGRDVVEAELDKERVGEETGEAGGSTEEEEQMVLAAKATMIQKTFHEPVKVMLDTERAAAVEDVNKSMESQESVIAESNTMDDVTQEINYMNDIVTSKDPLLGPVETHQEAPTPGNIALPPLPTQTQELGDIDVLVEKPADNTQSISPGQEVWKIGAIAAAFFLILQTVVTVVYILKCKRKPNSRASTVKGCEEGNGGVEINMVNTEIRIPAEEQTTLDDLPEDSEVQQEAIAMTTILTDSTVASYSNDP
ncbi:hypothetical protein AOLI_G00193480 [Acnodon oligacanthus]